MARSACGASGSPVPSVRSDCELWDLAPVQAAVTKPPSSSLLSSGAGSGKDGVQVVRGERTSGLKSVFLYRDLPDIYLQMSAPIPASTPPTGEVLESPPPSLFRVNRKAKGSARLCEERIRGLGQLHPLGLAPLVEASSS